MLFKRSLISNASLMPTPMRGGDGFLGNPVVTEKTTNVDHAITVAEISTGVLYYSALSAGRAVTTPTAALILAAAPDMDVGDSFVFLVSIQDAFAITWVAADADVTLRGRATTPASSSTWIVVTKTSDTDVTWFVA